MLGTEVEVEEEGEIEEGEQEREEMVVVATNLGLRIIREVVEGVIEVQVQVIMEEEEQAIINSKILEKVSMMGKFLIILMKKMIGNSTTLINEY